MNKSIIILFGAFLITVISADKFPISLNFIVEDVCPKINNVRDIENLFSFRKKGIKVPELEKEITQEKVNDMLVKYGIIKNIEFSIGKYLRGSFAKKLI